MTVPTWPWSRTSPLTRPRCGHGWPGWPATPTGTTCSAHTPPQAPTGTTCPPPTTAALVEATRPLRRIRADIGHVITPATAAERDAAIVTFDGLVTLLQRVADVLDDILPPE